MPGLSTYGLMIVSPQQLCGPAIAFQGLAARRGTQEPNPFMLD